MKPVQKSSPKQTKRRLPPRSPLDQKIHRRQYQKSINKLEMIYQKDNKYTGFTNQILIHEPDNKTINYFIPVYTIFKIKSIQELDIRRLIGSISCAIIINVLIEDLPEPLIHLLSNQINIQINRSQLMQLKENTEHSINFKRTQKMIKFIIRTNITCTIMEETLWSPFEIIKLVISITFNSMKKDGEVLFLECYQKQANQKERFRKRISKISHIGKQSPIKCEQLPDNSKFKHQIQFDPQKQYVINFNCMRSNTKIPISYARRCGHSLYDIAENLFQSYHTHMDSYNQIIRSCERENKEQKKLKKQQKQIQAKKIKQLNKCMYSESELVLKHYLQKLQNQANLNQKDTNKVKQPKIKYFQYSHYVIPLYKYPSNSLATMFIPIFLLSMLSLAIFFEQNNFSHRIGSIATMVLGYIALIPSIKQQLPPSSKITIIQIVIYISTLCCLFSLVQSYLVDSHPDYVFIWDQNILFMVCLIIHSLIFIFILMLVFIHKFIWQKSYNADEQVILPNPQKKRYAWINLYCDQFFYQANKKIQEINKLNVQKDGKQAKKINQIKIYRPAAKQPSEPAPTVQKIPISSSQTKIISLQKVQSKDQNTNNKQKQKYISIEKQNNQAFTQPKETNEKNNKNKQYNQKIENEAQILAQIDLKKKSNKQYVGSRLQYGNQRQDLIQTILEGGFKPRRSEIKDKQLNKIEKIKLK